MYPLSSYPGTYCTRFIVPSSHLDTQPPEAKRSFIPRNSMVNESWHKCIPPEKIILHQTWVLSSRKCIFYVAARSAGAAWRGLGRGPSGVQGRSSGGGLGGRSPPENFKNIIDILVQFKHRAGSSLEILGGG